MQRECLQESKLPAVFTQSGSHPQLGHTFYPVPRCQRIWARILPGPGRGQAELLPQAAVKGWEVMWQQKGSCD